MNHLERAFDKQNKWWKPLLLVLGIISVSLIIETFLVFLFIVFNPSDSMLESIKQNPDLLLEWVLQNQNMMFVLIFISSCVSLLISSLLIRALYKRNFVEVINGTQRIRWNRFFYGFGIWFGLMALYLLISYLFNPSSFIVNFNFWGFILLLFLSIVVIPVQASFEEFIFRGYLAQLFGSWSKNRWASIIFPSIIFGLVHIMNPEVNEYGFWIMVPQYIFMGVIFGLISVLDDGIECAMGAHTANNVFLCLFLTFDGSVLQTEAVFRTTEINPVIDFISLITMSGIFIVILGAIYRWDFKSVNSKIEPINKIDLT